MLWPRKSLKVGKMKSYKIVFMVICAVSFSLPQTQSSFINPIVNCLEGEVKVENCNLCKCKDKLWDCSERFCPISTTERQPENDPRVHHFLVVCTEGARKFEDCNECYCILNEWQCTKNVCNAKQRPHQQSSELNSEQYLEEELRNTPCSPDDKFNIDCSQCFCNQNGRGYKCILQPTCPGK